MIEHRLGYCSRTFQSRLLISLPHSLTPLLSPSTVIPGHTDFLSVAQRTRCVQPIHYEPVTPEKSNEKSVSVLSSYSQVVDSRATFHRSMQLSPSRRFPTNVVYREKLQITMSFPRSRTAPFASSARSKKDALHMRLLRGRRQAVVDRFSHSTLAPTHQHPAQLGAPCAATKPVSCYPPPILIRTHPFPAAG